MPNKSDAMPMVRSATRRLISKTRTPVTTLNDPIRTLRLGKAWVIGVAAAWFAAIALLKGLILFRWMPIAKMLPGATSRLLGRRNRRSQAFYKRLGIGDCCHRPGDGLSSGQTTSARPQGIGFVLLSVGE